MPRNLLGNSHDSAWQKLNADDRQPYKQTARHLQKDAHQSHINAQIETLVQTSVQHGDLASHSYYFIMANWFHSENMPSELAVAQFALNNGLQNIYHTVIDPAFDNDDLNAIQTDLLEFLRLACGPGDMLPPVFTLQSKIGIVSKSLKLLNGGKVSQLNVLPIEYLCYVLKKATCEAAMLLPPGSIYITNYQFNLDPYESLLDLGCELHKQQNRSKQCCKSYVKRWGFAFATYMCPDLDIKMLPNRHKPSKCNEKDLKGSPEPAQQLDTKNIKLESTTSDEKYIHQKALDTLNSLDLDSIFENDDIWGSALKDNTSSNSESLNNSEKEDNVVDAEQNVELVPPPPPILDQKLIDDCAIFKRRPKKSQNDSDNNKINIPTEKCEMANTKIPLTNKQSITVEKPKQCFNRNRVNGSERPVVSERDRDRLHPNKCWSPIRQTYRRPTHCHTRWRSSSRSRSRSLSRTSHDHRGNYSSRKSRRSRSRSPSRRIFIDRNIGRDRRSSPIRRRKYHGSSSPSPRRLKCDVIDDDRRSERQSREQRKHSSSPSLGVTNNYSRYHKAETTKAQKSDINLIETRNSLQLSPQRNRPKFRITLNEHVESQYHANHTINIQNFHFNSVSMNTEKPVGSHVMNVKPSQSESTNNRIPVLTTVPSQIPSQITYENSGSNLSYNREVYYGLEQHSQVPYESHPPLETAKMRNLPDNDLRHRLKKRHETSSEMDNYSWQQWQQNLAHPYQMSAWPRANSMPWCNEYGYYFPNNYY